MDRDATVFPVILNFLRDGNRTDYHRIDVFVENRSSSGKKFPSGIPLPQDEYFLRRIQREAEFFALAELVERLDRFVLKCTPTATRHFACFAYRSNRDAG